MAKTLLILGNGFDLDLGLKTSYRDFIQEIYKNKYCSEDTNPLIDAMLKEEKLNQWIDIEEFLRNYAQSYNNKPIENDRDIKNEYTKLCRDLNSYMYVDKYPSEKYDDCSAKFHYDVNSTAVKLLRLLSQIEDVKIYSFNYTDLELVIESLNSIDDAKIDWNKRDIVYIHGKVASQYGEIPPIILGIDDISVKDAFDCMKKASSPFYEKGIIKDLSQAEHVVFFGLALGVTDFPYFTDFFVRAYTNDNKPRISVFTIDGQPFFSRVSKMINRNIANIQENINMAFYYTNIKGDFEKFLIERINK